VSTELTPEDVAEILRLLDASQFTEVEVESQGMVISFKRRTPLAQSYVPGAITGSPVGKTYAEVRSPTPGLFYRASGPGQPPFVEVGSPVLPETIVCIIEVMKLMNPIDAGAQGTIEEICVTDGAEVSEGQVLFRVATT